MFRKLPLFIVVFLFGGLMWASSPGFSLTADPSANDIEWNLSVGNTTIQTAVVPFGEDFVFNSDIAAKSGSQELLEGLNGISFSLEQTPVVPGKIIIDVKLNVQGNYFTRVSTFNCFFNMTVDMYVNGEKEDSPLRLIMTIPARAPSPLIYLLDKSGINRDEIDFASYSGGSFAYDDIKMDNLNEGLIVHFTAGSQVVGGKRTDLGVPASVGYSNWYKIKKLFE
jgi:hypothetical protein